MNGHRNLTKQKILPIIGITTYGRDNNGDFHLPGQYVDAVRKAGGIPLLLPPGDSHPDQILDVVDGLIFAGGGDIDPALYGGSSHPAVSRVDPERDAFEMALAQKTLSKNAPVLGICRGAQLLNVATGGNLVEHVPDEFGFEILHQTKRGDGIEHLVQIVPRSRLAKITGATEMSVVSMHHQAVRTIPTGWTVVAQSADGVIEGLEYEPHPWMVSVLWHPELSLDDQQSHGIFHGLIEAARKRKSG